MSKKKGKKKSSKTSEEETYLDYTVRIYGKAKVKFIFKAKNIKFMSGEPSQPPPNPPKK